MPPIPVFDPTSGQTRAISDLFILILAIAFGIVMLVSFLLIFVAFKFRQRGPSDLSEPAQVAGSKKLEIFWTVTPAIVLLLVTIPTVLAMGTADPTVSAEKKAQPDVEIIGHQWWWEIRYPKEGIVTANELHLQLGAKVASRLKSADVIHAFWVPQLAPQKDLNPGQDNELTLQPEKPGVLYGACAEYCGGAHAWMLLRVIVQPEAQYNAWVAEQQKAAPPPSNGNPVHGQQVFLGNTCVNCHAIAGTSAIAAVGPNLSHLGSRSTIGAGVVENTTQNLTRWIRNAADLKPGLHMPGYPQLSDADLNDLVTYLEGLK